MLPEQRQFVKHAMAVLTLELERRRHRLNGRVLQLSVLNQFRFGVEDQRAATAPERSHRFFVVQPASFVVFAVRWLTVNEVAMLDELPSLPQNVLAAATVVVILLRIFSHVFREGVCVGETSVALHALEGVLVFEHRRWLDGVCCVPVLAQVIFGGEQFVTGAAPFALPAEHVDAVVHATDHFEAFQVGTGSDLWPKGVDRLDLEHFLVWSRAVID